MRQIIGDGLSFDDVLIQPQYSNVIPVDISTEVVFCGIKLKIPILSSPMDTVTEYKMAIAIGESGGLGIIHRGMPFEQQIEQVKLVKNAGQKVGLAIGVNTTSDHIKMAIDEGVDLLIIDTAHGHSKNVLSAIATAKAVSNCPQLVAGNIATANAARTLISAGVNGLRTGIGPGSACTTRVVSGVGVPQLTAILEVADAVDNSGADVSIIADGGIRYSGDIVKALGAGATVVMLGSMLAGTDESPGIEVDGFKTYRGMGSAEAMKNSDRYGNNSAKLTPEGVSGKVRSKGPVKKVLSLLSGGLRSGMGYVGANNIPELKENTYFYRITTAALKESHPHSLSSIDGDNNCSNPTKNNVTP
jgi:IMP dehydrogenase